MTLPTSHPVRCGACGEWFGLPLDAAIGSRHQCPRCPVSIIEVVASGTGGLQVRRARVSSSQLAAIQSERGDENEELARFKRSARLAALDVIHEMRGEGKLALDVTLTTDALADQIVARQRASFAELIASVRHGSRAEGIAIGLGTALDNVEKP